MASYRRTRIIVGSVLAVLGSVAAWTPGPVSAASRLPAFASSVPSPGQSSRLNSVAAIAPGDAWAVGNYCVSNCKAITVRDRYMIMHWNGKTWSLKVSGAMGTLNGVSAVSASDVWAVGSTPRSPLLFLHWNGSHWSRQAASLPGAGLVTVDALSSHSVWAVGSAYNARLRAYVTLIEHWNGRKWSQTAAPAVASRNGSASLLTVSADSSRDGWAAGSYCASACRSSASVNRGFILHWNGSTWSRSQLPVANSFEFSVVTALSRTDAWAIGATIKGHAATTLMLHWNGAKWNKVSIPNDYPMAMAFISPTDGWAVGLSTAGLHWDGTKWSEIHVPIPNVGGAVDGASGDAPGDAWIVGALCTPACTNPGVALTRGFILHWNGSKWSRA